MRLFRGISELITNAGVKKKKGTRVEESDLGILTDAALVLDSSGKVLWYGSNAKVPGLYLQRAKVERIDGKCVSPALVDCHTHLVFAGSRHSEFSLRLRGATYQEIAAQGGGIASTVTATRLASEDQLFEMAKDRVEMLETMGVGCIEIKSGYGLTRNSEIKILRVIARLKAKYKKKHTILSTYLGAHALPPDWRGARGAYIDEVLNTLDSMGKASKTRPRLADFCDVFMDQGYFSKTETTKILEKAKRTGLGLRLHADELAATGGAELAAQMNAFSADHLLHASLRGLQAMAKAKTVAVLLPTTALYLGLAFPNIARFRKAGVCLGLGTDYNPGTSPTLNLPLVMFIACAIGRLTTAESFAAATYGSARALGLHRNEGSISIGQKPHIAIWNFPHYQELLTNFGHPSPCEKIISPDPIR